MFKSYLKIAYRNLFKNKLHSSINVAGLIIGFTIGIAILLVVYDQFSYDDFHNSGKRIYQVYQAFNNPEGEAVVNSFGFAAAPVYKAEAPSIEAISRIVDGGNHIEYEGKDRQIPVTLVDQDFLSMFSFTILEGNRSSPLKNLSDAVITEEAAKKIFGKEDPIGKTIRVSIDNTMQSLVVSCIIKDVVNSSINFQVLSRIENRPNYALEKSNWDNRSPSMYVELRDGATQQQAELQLKQIDKKYVPEWYIDMAKKGAKADAQGDLFSTRLLPLSEVHFSIRVNGHHAISYLQIITVMTVGLFILFIACFNFVNINLANAFTRSKEIGVRKCLGVARWKLFAQLWIESLLVCSIAFIISLFCVNLFLQSLTGFEQARLALISILWRPGFILLAVILLLFVSLVAGGYPSWMMIQFKIVESLKGKISMKRKSGLRSSLIIVQFVIASIMITSTYIIYQQYQFLQNADLGVDKSYVISMPLHNPVLGRETIEKLRVRLSGDPHILSLTGSNINLGRGADHRTVKISTDFTYKDRQIHTNMASVDFDYLKTFGLNPLEGRDFDQAFGADSGSSILISASVARQFKESNLIGKTIGGDSSFRGWRIVGIFPDFHLYSMEEAMEPLSLTFEPKAPINYCFIKTTSQNPMAALESIKKEMELLEPGQEFTGSFVDENVSNWYQSEKTLSLLFSIAAAIAILLSCSGLLAVVLLIIQQRVKEIGLRKVLGASVQNIAFLISREFIELVLISILIATPISWFAMSKWLQDFPYRIHLQVWMFALVGLCALFIALLTICINTVRAANQNPVKSLRTD